MVREPPPLHVRIRKLLKDRPYSRKELMDELNKMKIKITEGRLDGTLKRMREWKEIKTLSDGRYAEYSYSNLEEKIENFFKKHGIEKVITKDWLKPCAFETRENQFDSEFEKAFYKVAKKLGIAVID